MIRFGNYRRLALDFDRARLAVRQDELEAFGITDAALGRDFYGKLIETLQDYDGYVLERGHGSVTKPSVLARETLDPGAPQNEDSVIPSPTGSFSASTTPGSRPTSISKTTC